MLSIHVRPPEVEDRLMPGHWEGDLIKGKANASAVGTLVERTSGYLMLIKMADATATSALEGFSCGAQWHAAGGAQEHDLRPGPGDGAARRDHPADRGGDLLLRPAQPLATRQQSRTSMD